MTTILACHDPRREGDDGRAMPNPEPIYLAVDDLRSEIVDQDGRLAFLKEGGFPRGLVHLGDNACHPLGAPSVRLLFGVVGGRVGRIVIRGGGEELIARLAR